MNSELIIDITNQAVMTTTIKEAQHAKGLLST